MLPDAMDLRKCRCAFNEAKSALTCPVHISRSRIAERQNGAESRVLYVGSDQKRVQSVELSVTAARTGFRLRACRVEAPQRPDTRACLERMRILSTDDCLQRLSRDKNEARLHRQRHSAGAFARFLIPGQRDIDHRKPARTGNI